MHGGVSHLHGQHCPQGNVLITSSGTAVLADFGLAHSDEGSGAGQHKPVYK